MRAVRSTRLTFFLAALSLGLAGALARAQDETPEPTPAPSPESRPAPVQSSGTTRVTLLFTSDIHGHYLPKLSLGKRTPRKGEELPKPVKVGGIAAIASKVHELRAAGANLLVLDSGDVMSGHPVCDLERGGAKGGALFQMLNEVGYDAWAIGNHDFDHGRENVAKLLAIAKFPTVSANLKISEDGPPLPVKRWIVLERFGLKIGIFGLMTDGFEGVVAKDKHAGVAVTHARDAAREAVSALRPQCDLVICLSHCGYNEDLRLVKDVEGIDVVLSGHDHRVVEPHLVGKTVIAESAFYGHRLGRIDLYVDAQKKVAGWEGRLHVLPHAPAVGKLKELVDDAYEACVKPLEVVIGKLETILKKNSRGEANIGDFFCDGLCAQLGAQVSFLNSGGIREDIEAGEITVGQVAEVFPFDNELVEFELTGAELLKALERNAQATVGGFHGILQVGGARYTFKKTGSRDAKLVEAQVGGAVVDPAKTYKCVSTDFVAVDQAEKYLGVVPKSAKRLGKSLQALAIEHAKAAGAKGPIRIETDGRMKAEKD